MSSTLHSQCLVVFPQGYPNAQIKDSQCRINLAKHISGRENEKHRLDSIHFLSLESKVREIKLLRGLKVVISAHKTLPNTT